MAEVLGFSGIKDGIVMYRYSPDEVYQQDAYKWYAVRRHYRRTA
jgi:hypothetical protein